MATDQEIRGWAITTLQREAQALNAVTAALPAELGESLTKAVRAILEVSGYVVTSGIGKSGLIARKVSSTLASTGTPSVFLSAAEAGHGDLGMIYPGNLLMAFSYSGESAELESVYRRARTLNLTIIGVSGNAQSALARHSDIALILPELTEAGADNVVPTSSTTAQLALGDAIAIACMEARGFKVSNFRELHPGGTLGARLSRVADVMRTGDSMPLVACDETMDKAVISMSRCRVGCVGITQAVEPTSPRGNAGSGRASLIGIITDGDLRRHMEYPDLLSQSVQKVMTRHPKTITADKMATQARSLMHQHSITSLFVVEGDTPIGVLHMHDLARL